MLETGGEGDKGYCFYTTSKTPTGPHDDPQDLCQSLKKIVPPHLSHLGILLKIVTLPPR